jgi:hypothetical protein
MTPPEETGDAYILRPKSFMPNGEDLSKIREWISTQTGYYLEAPETLCEERTGEEDENIAVEIIKPLNGATLTKNFEVWYTVL